jgi:hypothetical protein
MAEIELNDVISLSARLEAFGAYSIVNRFHVIIDNGAPATFAAWQVAFQNYLDTLYGNLSATLSAGVLPDSIGVRNETQGLVFGSMSWGAWAGGTALGDPTPLGVACLTFGRTVKPRVQIRKYFGIFTEANCNAAAWDGVVQGACVNALTYHITQQTPAVGQTLTGVAYNRTLGTVTYASSVATSAEPAYQRRRKRGRGS